MAARRIGLVFELLGSPPPEPDPPPDADAEYEPEETVQVLEQALRHLGHEPLRIGAPHALLRAAGRGELPQLDAALSIAEGYATRNREAWAPILLEMLSVPALGSDALTLSLSLDKAWTQAVVEAAGVPVPARRVLREPAQAADCGLDFPLFVKPRWEGTSKGIHRGSRVEGPEALAREVERVVQRYRQPALVETFLSGPEYTVTLVGNDPPRVLPVLQRALDRESDIGAHAVAASEAESYVPGELDAALEERLAALARRAFAALECRDFARVDLRLDAAGRPHFLEINPLPTFAPEGSFGILAELAGRPLPELLAEVLEGGLRRIGL